MPFRMDRAFDLPLVIRRLEIHTASHRPAVNFVYYTVLREKPHFVAPFLIFSGLWILGVVVIDEVDVFEVVVKCLLGRDGEAFGSHGWEWHDGIEMKYDVTSG